MKNRQKSSARPKKKQMSAKARKLVRRSSRRSEPAAKRRSAEPRGLSAKLEATARELSEARAQQAAVSDILRVISSSPTDVQPVFDAIAENALRLCEAIDVIIRRVEGSTARMVSHIGPVPVLAESVSISRMSHLGRVVRECRTIHIHDFRDPSVRKEYPEAIVLQHQETAYRTALIVPLVRENAVVGTIEIRRPEPRAFSEKQIKLLETFAAQAVIAIENVRLFNETKEALDQQTATAEILRVISNSPTDIQPMLDAVVESAARLCAAEDCQILLFEGNIHRPAAHYGSIPLEKARAFAGKGPVGPAMRGRRTVSVVDALQEYPESQMARRGVRSALVVPLLRDQDVIGAVVLRRLVVEAFTDKQIRLLETFAAQAVIAIENVRLFHEIQDKTRQLEVASRHKSEFLASMSHELRTPLNAILGFSEVLAEQMFGEVNEKQAEYLHDIHASGAHLLSLINDILDLAKIEAGRMDLECTTFDMRAALDNALTLIRERAGRHGLKLELECDPQIGAWTADERKFKQIMLNLLSNAVKFTPAGGRIGVSASRADGALEIAVTDSGVGIKPEDQPLVFEEFRQVGGDSTAKAQGTGLGLALTKKFVELHGGSIGVQSEPGRGSTFTFTLPLLQ